MLFTSEHEQFRASVRKLVEEEINGRKRYFVDCVAGAKVIAAVPNLRVRSVRKAN